MRVPSTVIITDDIFGGPKKLEANTGDKEWIVYGGLYSSGDSLTPVPGFYKNKAGISNVHITVPGSDDVTTVVVNGAAQDFMRATEFHVTFMFSSSDFGSLRFAYKEKNGTATLMDQDGKTLFDVQQQKNPLGGKLVIENNQVKLPDQDTKWGAMQGKTTKWVGDDLRDAADRIAKEFYSQCQY